MNPARAALSRAVNRAIANGAPVFTNESAVIVRLAGVNGEGEALFPAAAWDSLSPCGQVLALHEKRRDLTAGRPFEIVRVHRT